MTNRLATLNLQTEAEAFGIHKDRLLFQGKLKDYYQHVEELGSCRLMMDAPLCVLPTCMIFPSFKLSCRDFCRYNAHTSAGDVLWAGVPIVTLPGELMVTRGASSLLISGGGAITVAKTFEEYEDLVCRP
jgi:predicted O-linked N-acetylglucosamine transferase (SPINDLY family)